MNDTSWSLAQALWKREGWQIVETPDLHSTYGPDGYEDVVGTRIVLVRGLDRVEVCAPTEKRARTLMFEKMEGN